MEFVTVSASALRSVLQALNGPPHFIRELQATRNLLPGLENNNPINTLCDEYNAAVQAQNAVTNGAKS